MTTQHRLPTTYHIQADLVPMRADVALPHWTTETRGAAERLAQMLRQRPDKFQNVTIREHKWGHH